MDERELVEGLRKGENSALVELIDKYAPKLTYILVSSLELNDIDAKCITYDTLHDIFLKKIRKYKYNGSFKNWLYKTCMNSARDFLRQCKDLHISLEDAERINVRKDIGNIRIQEIEDKGRQDSLALIIGEAIESLDVKYREILECWSNGIQLSEIAQMYGIRKGTARQRKCRAVKYVKEFVERKMSQRYPFEL